MSAAKNQKAHNRQIVIWDAPPTIECGERFSIKLGVKCASACRPDAWVLDVKDHEGNQLASATLSNEPWRGTAALHYAEVELTAPDSEGLYAWSAIAPASDGDRTRSEVSTPDAANAEADTLAVRPVSGHGETNANFNIRVVPKPECLLTVVAMDEQNQTPVARAKVVVHPYRAFTDARGVAEIHVPKGEYRLFVSGKNYFAFQSSGKVNTDMTITAELSEDRAPSDADLWA